MREDKLPQQLRPERRRLAVVPVVDHHHVEALPGWKPVVPEQDLYEDIFDELYERAVPGVEEMEETEYPEDVNLPYLHFIDGDEMEEVIEEYCEEYDVPSHQVMVVKMPRRESDGVTARLHVDCRLEGPVSMTRNQLEDISIASSEVFREVRAEAVERAIKSDVDVRGAWEFQTKGSTPDWEVEIVELARESDDLGKPRDVVSLLVAPVPASVFRSPLFTGNGESIM